MIHQLVRRRVLLVLLAFAALFFGIRVPQAYSALQTKNVRIRQMQERNDALRDENRKLKTWLNEVNSEPTERERFLRERYDKQRQGDTTFMLKDGKSK